MTTDQERREEDEAEWVLARRWIRLHWKEALDVVAEAWADEQDIDAMPPSTDNQFLVAAEDAVGGAIMNREW